MQDTVAFESEPHTDFIFIVQESWSGASLFLGILVAAAGFLLWRLHRRRRRNPG